MRRAMFKTPWALMEDVDLVAHIVAKLLDKTRAIHGITALVCQAL